MHTRNLATFDCLSVAGLAGVPCRVHGEHGRDIMDLDGSTKSVLNVGTGNLSFTGVDGVLVGKSSNQIFQYNADYQKKTNTSSTSSNAEFSDIGLLPNGYEAIMILYFISLCER